MATHVYMIFMTPLAGREAEYSDYYENQHIGDVLKVPGIMGCRRMKLAAGFPNTEGFRSFLALYDLETDDGPAAVREVRARLGTPQMPKSPAADASMVRSMLHRVISDTPAAADWSSSKTPRSSKHVLVVLSDPKAGEEEAFNRFYEEVQAPAVMSVPGFVGYRRLTLDAGLPPSEGSQSHAILYEIATDDMAAVSQEFLRRANAGEIPHNPHGDASKEGAYALYDVVYEAHR